MWSSEVEKKMLYWQEAVEVGAERAEAEKGLESDEGGQILRGWSVIELRTEDLTSVFKKSLWLLYWKYLEGEQEAEKSGEVVNAIIQRQLTGLVTTMNNEGDEKGQVLGIFWRKCW